MSDDLHIHQADILRFMEEYLAENGFPPSTREIGAGVNIPSTSQVAYHMKALAAKGYITKQGHTARSTVILRSLRQRGVPLYGFIAAGMPLQISDEPQETIDLGPRYATHPDAFALRVRGKSMIEDLIDDGDLIVVVPTNEAHDGETVVAVHKPFGEPGASTLKRFYKERGRVRLQPANSAIEPILVTAREWDWEWEVQARVIEVIRRC